MGDGDLPSVLEVGRNCWRIEEADRVALIIDAADYFAAVQKALRGARRQVLMIGWDFDTRICLDGPAGKDGTTLARFIRQLAQDRPELQIHILKWNLGALKILGRGKMLLSVLRWIQRRNITMKLDGAHPVGASHHQKLVVIDDALAFCGGIDMTSDRWDTRDHRDDDPRRLRPDGKPYGPWHDVTMALSGPVARALADLGRERWQRATGQKLPAGPMAADPWPEDLKPTFRDVPVAVSRTRSEHAGCGEIRENEALFVDLVASARTFIYAENQYFASRVIAEAVARRMQEPDPPEFVLVMPETADGWLEQVAMDTARTQLLAMIAKVDHRKRFRVYHPVTDSGEPIYVHAKLMIVDDEVLRVGSSNMNNRSLGLDSECDVTIDARRCDDQNMRGVIGEIRKDLLSEHLGCARSKLECGHSMIDSIERLRSTRRSLRPFAPDEHGAAAALIAEKSLFDPGDEGAPDYEAIGQRQRWLSRLSRPRR